MIYFIQAETGGPIKIGYTSKPFMAGRLKSLRAFCPYPLTVLATCDGAAADEKKVLRRFKDHRIRGEWFHPADALVNFISTLDAPTPKAATHQ